MLCQLFVQMGGGNRCFCHHKDAFYRLVQTVNQSQIGLATFARHHTSCAIFRLTGCIISLHQIILHFANHIGLPHFTGLGGNTGRFINHNDICIFK